MSTLDDTDWDDFCPGVRIKALWEGGARRTVLVRMRAGASVKAHAHALEEECMMLAGEAFIGDTLLRSGEYQLAPQGSRHGEVSTDVGSKTIRLRVVAMDGLRIDQIEMRDDA